MIDGFLNTLRKSGERVQRRSEEVAQAARLRLDIFQLGREQGVMYARLGRAYHANASVSTLEEIRAEIARVDEEITAREKLLAELGADEVSEGGAAVDLHKPATPFSSAPVQSAHPQSPPAQPAQPQAARSQSDQTLSTVWKEKEAGRMSDSEREYGAPTDATGRPDGETGDVTRDAGGDRDKKPYASSTGVATNPNEAGSPDKLRPTADTASMGNEAARDEMVRHEAMLKEGKRASENPDPLANKD